MLVTITKVHPTEPILMGNITAPGYWVDVYVEAGEARFALTANEIGEQGPKVEDVICFKLEGLSLWDENI